MEILKICTSPWTSKSEISTYPSGRLTQQEGQDGPGSLTWFFEIALANFFFVAFREEFTRISLCLYSARSLHSLIHVPCLLTDQNFKNNSEKGHSRNISMRLFQNLTNSFREDFLWFCLCSYCQVAPIHQSLVHGQIRISLTFLKEVTLRTFLWIGKLEATYSVVLIDQVFLLNYMNNPKALAELYNL